MKFDVYIATSVNDENVFSRNRRIIDLFKSLNISYYLPQIDSNASDEEIFKRNIDAISNSKGLLFLPDFAGEGVFIEVGYAIGKKIAIVAFSQTELKDHGRMTSGLWELLPKHFQTKTLNELQYAIKILLLR